MPGQFLVLKLNPKPDAAPVLRNYSMSGSPIAGVYRISVKQEMNGVGSTFLHRRVHVGDILEASAPRGTFTLRRGDGPVILLSAGIGATPVLAMLHNLVSEASPREVWWLYGARDGDNHPFAQESRDLVKALKHGRSYIAYSRPRSEDRLGQAYDGSGYLTVPVLEQLAVPRSADFYLCGPPRFLSPEDSITPGIVKPRRRMPHPPLGPAGTGPQVAFTRSGLTVTWHPKFQSLLEFAEACDVPVKWACRTGVCHTCECALISGRVAYQVDPLDPPLEGNALICCAQPQSDVELDL